ncbi:MAG: murein biosynthesis integral membrane protein MurJ [Patescibacteria group bacterium]|nr:murein biosynthesis integral membrane protein MurJ [Patescibacteria group bacterium]
MIKKLFNSQNSLKGATIILIVTFTFSNLLGLIRDHFLAQKIPTTFLDCYYAAFRLPDLIFNLLALGAISAAFIPVFSAYLAKKDTKEAWKVANSFLNIVVVFLIICLIILAILMPILIPLLVPDFDSEKLSLTIKLARLMLISPILFGISYILSSILNSFKRFLVCSFSPLVYNLSIIIFTVLFADKIGVYAPVIGVLVGALLHLSIQLPTAIFLGWRPSFIFEWFNSGVKKIIALIFPRAIGLGAMQIMLIFFTAIASSLGAGSIAVFNLADNIQTMPTAVFSNSLAVAIFPNLSQAASLDKKQEFSNLIWKSIRAIVMVLIPAGVAIILLRAQIVRLILGSGHFGWQQTIDTANTLGWFAAALVFQGLIPIIARAYYARHNTKTPTTISIICMALSVILAYILSRSMGVSGLALAFSISGFINALLLYVFLRQENPDLKIEEKNFLIFVTKVIFSTLIMAIIIQVTKYAINPFLDMTRFWGIFVQAGSSLLLGLTFYIGLALFFGFQELYQIIDVFKKRFIYGRQGIQGKK